MNSFFLKQSTYHGMGTIITHKIAGENAEKVLKKAEDKTRHLEDLLSRYISSSDISRINQSTGASLVTVHEETKEVLMKAIDISNRCQGFFDITIGPLVDLWNIYFKQSLFPDEYEIKETLPLINYRDLVFNPTNCQFGLKKIGQSIDLGGIGKGFAADQVLDVFRKNNITSAMTDFGGNIAVIGKKPDNTLWRVGIQHPRDENNLLGVISIEDQSVVTSGDYRRYYTTSQGRTHHHILNPQTGHSTESGLISVSVVSKCSMLTDALSTALFVAGFQKSKEILSEYKDVDAILVTEDLNVFITAGLKNTFESNKGIRINLINK